MKGKLEELTIEELDKSLTESKDNLKKERFSSVTSKVDNPKKIKELKKHIARILTLKKEYEIGIRTSKGSAASVSDAILKSQICSSLVPTRTYPPSSVGIMELPNSSIESPINELPTKVRFHSIAPYLSVLTTHPVDRLITPVKA